MDVQLIGSLQPFRVVCIVDWVHGQFHCRHHFSTRMLRICSVRALQWAFALYIKGRVLHPAAPALDELVLHQSICLGCAFR